MDGKLIIIILGLMLLPAAAAAGSVPADLQIITEDNAPLNYMDNGTLKGITVDLMVRMLSSMDSNLTQNSFQVLPWNEGYALVMNTPDTMMLSMDRLAERENQFLWAGPVITVPQVLFTLAGNPKSDAPDLSGMRIVTVADDCGKTYAIRSGADEQQIIEVPQTRDAVRMVENGSADGWVYNELAGRRAVEQYAGNPGLFRIGKELGTSRVFFAFNPDTSAEFVNVVNETIQRFKRDRTGTGITEYESVLAGYLPVQCTFNTSPKDLVIALVNQTSAAVATDAPGTFAAINAGKAPYRNQEDPNLYVFAFDSSVKLMANAASTENVGKNLAGTTDVAGKPFRDEMISGALQNGTGWVSYTYSNPESLGLYTKMSYYQLVNGSDGRDYIVGAGRYQTCDEASGESEAT